MERLVDDQGMINDQILEGQYNDAVKFITDRGIDTLVNEREVQNVAPLPTIETIRTDVEKHMKGSLAKIGAPRLVIQPIIPTQVFMARMQCHDDIKIVSPLSENNFELTRSNVIVPRIAGAFFGSPVQRFNFSSDVTGFYYTFADATTDLEEEAPSDIIDCSNQLSPDKRYLLTFTEYLSLVMIMRQKGIKIDQDLDDLLVNSINCAVIHSDERAYFGLATDSDRGSNSLIRTGIRFANDNIVDQDFRPHTENGALLFGFGRSSWSW